MQCGMIIIHLITSILYSLLAFLPDAFSVSVQAASAKRPVKRLVLSQVPRGGGDKFAQFLKRHPVEEEPGTGSQTDERNRTHSLLLHERPYKIFANPSPNFFELKFVYCKLKSEPFRIKKVLRNLVGRYIGIVVFVCHYFGILALGTHIWSKNRARFGQVSQTWNARLRHHPSALWRRHLQGAHRAASAQEEASAQGDQERSHGGQDGM